MKTFATFATPGTFLAGGVGEVLVGRLVANTEFLRAIFRYGSFERFALFCGEGGDAQSVNARFVETGLLDARRLILPNLLELPRLVEAGELSVIHHASHQESFLDLIWLRDRHARCPLPVTAQIHSLSYPRSQLVPLRAFLLPPSEQDAIFCSSEAGRRALEESFAAVAGTLRAVGAAPTSLDCELPVVPLGIDVERVTGGDRERTRAQLGLQRDAFVVLAMGRFSEYDKMDLFPVLQAFAGAVKRVSAKREDRRLMLLLAGARQGTKTPEMLALWAKLLRIPDRVLIQVDFAEERKKDLLAAADLFLSASDNPQETFGLSVIEAMAAGLPVVVSDFDGYKETVTDDVGLRIPTRWNGDVEFLRDLSPVLYERPLHLLLGQSLEVDLPAMELAIAELYRDAARRDGMARAAAERGRIYDWSRIIPRYEEVWRRLAEKRLVPRTPVGAHPLGMDFGRTFAHFPTSGFDGARRVRSTELARQICLDVNNYPIYPELKQLIGDGDVIEALELAKRGIAAGELTSALATRHTERPAWRARYLVGWLLKHGLLG